MQIQPIPAEWDELRLQQELFGAAVPAAVAWRKNPPPDFAAIQRELQTHRNLTLQLIWEEQRASQPKGYGYGRFCELYRNWQKKLYVVLRHDHRVGEKLFVDYAGDTIPVWNPESGEVAFRAAIFVAAVGASNYNFAEATESQELRCWIGSHLRVFDCGTIFIHDGNDLSMNLVITYRRPPRMFSRIAFGTLRLVGMNRAPAWYFLDGRCA